MSSVNLESLVETGMVQYFHHSPSSQLPVRDVLSDQGQGFKTEPQIEECAENYHKPCYQANIRKFAASDRKYLFLVTTCRNNGITQYQSQLIIGYIIKENILERPSPDGGAHLCVQGPTFLYSFEDSLSVKSLFGRNYTRPLLNSTPFVDGKKTRVILASFSGKENIYSACVRELERLKKCLPSQ